MAAAVPLDSVEAAVDETGCLEDDFPVFTDGHERLRLGMNYIQIPRDTMAYDTEQTDAREVDRWSQFRDLRSGA